MSSFTVASNTRNRTRNVMLGAGAVGAGAAGAAAGAAAGSAVVPVIGTAVGAVVGFVGGLWKGNIAAARAEDIANQKRAFEQFDSPAFAMGSYEKNRAAWYIADNPSFYTPDIIAQAWAYIASTAGTKDPYNNAVQEKMTREFPMQAASARQNRHAEFITGNPQYHNQALINMASAYQQTGGKSYDLKTVSQPTVTIPGGVPSGTVPSVSVPSIQSVYGGAPSVMTASMFGGKTLPVIFISGIVLTVAYKLFFEKKTKSRGRKR